MTVPIEVQIKAVQREIVMREYVYPKRIEQKKMSQKKADEELDAMKAVLETLKTVAQSQRLI